MKNNRRTFLKVLPAIPLSFSFGNWDLGTGEHAEGMFVVPPTPLKKIGTVKLKKPEEISASPFGIGCETLDRGLWEPREIYPWLDNLPVKWARLQTGWARVEREKGKYDWAWLDESVDGLMERGIQPFFNVGYGNAHYTEGEVGYHPVNKPAAMQAWKRFVEALVKRYKNRVSHYEIWNEPNISPFWKPDKPNPSSYIQLVRETAPLIRRLHSGAIIVGGVLARMPFNYVRSLFREGLAEFIDIFSYHPYATIPESFTDRFKALRKLIDSYRPAIKIWQGENGFPSQAGSGGFPGEGPWTENIQAKIMLRRLLTDCSLDVPMTLWFLIVDLHGYRGSGKVNYKGILRAKPEVAPKVAYRALQNLGSLVYGNVKTANALIYLMDGKQEATEKEYELFGNGLKQSLPNTVTTMLRTEKGKALAYWWAGKAEDTCAERVAHLFLWDWEEDGFEEPVLVDLLLGDVYEVGDTERRDAQLFCLLPLKDYPLLIMEKKEVL